MQNVWRGIASPVVDAAKMSSADCILKSATRFYQLKQTRANLPVVASLLNVSRVYPAMNFNLWE